MAAASAAVGKGGGEGREREGRERQEREGLGREGMSFLLGHGTEAPCSTVQAWQSMPSSEAQLNLSWVYR